MKVVIIKKCKDGDVNDIIDVKDGYGKNFLIKNGYALPFNESTRRMVNNKKEKMLEINKKRKENDLKVKSAIEKITITFSLKTTNNVVHGSISRKQVINSLKENGIKLDSHMIENVHIQSIGTTNVRVDISKNTTALLKVKVINEK